MKIKPTNKIDISILGKNGDVITDPKKIVNCFNQYFANIGPNIENKVLVGKTYTNNLKDIRI